MFANALVRSNIGTPLLAPSCFTQVLCRRTSHQQVWWRMSANALAHTKTDTPLLALQTRNTEPCCTQYIARTPAGAEAHVRQCAGSHKCQHALASTTSARHTIAQTLTSRYRGARPPMCAGAHTKKDMYLPVLLVGLPCFTQILCRRTTHHQVLKHVFASAPVHVQRWSAPCLTRPCSHRHCQARMGQGPAVSLLPAYMCVCM